MRQPNLKVIKKAVERARDIFEDEGTIEIDDPIDNKALKGMASAADNSWKTDGMYIKAWVWVPAEEYR